MTTWIDPLLRRCKLGSLPVTAHPHAIMRQGQRGIDPRYMQFAVRRGRVVEHKCRAPRKLCLEYYDGKTRTTYGVYVLVRDTFLEVMAVYRKRGGR